MAKDVKELSDSELEKKLEGAKVAFERASGAVKKFAEKKLKKFEDEVERRASEGEADVKAAAKDAKKEVEKVEKEVEKVIEPKPKAETKVEDKPKKAPKKRPRTYASPTEKFELVIDGKTFKFDDLKSKQECERAKKAVEARYKETKEHKAATKEGIERSKTISVTKRITEGFASIAKKAIAEVPTTKIQKNPSAIASELAEVEKAFDVLFDKLGTLMNKQIPKTQRKQIMDILTKFENKVEKGSDKKTAATSKTKKEDGGFASSVDDSWSYASFL
tara:strand:- start:765 stop:1592 length:828 start_codon:yes stop_codon:yes gene_type:complete